MTQITQPSSSYLILLLLLPTPACNTHDKYETPPIPMERADSSNPAGPGAEATPHGLPRSDAASTDERASAEIENRQPNCEWREKPKDEVFVDGQEEPIVPHHCYSPIYNIMVYKNVSLTQGRIEWVQPPKTKGGKPKSHPGIENEHKAAILYATYVCNHNFKGNWGEANKAALVVNKDAKHMMDKAVPRGKSIGRGYGGLQPRERSQRGAPRLEPVPESDIQSSHPTARDDKIGWARQQHRVFDSAILSVGGRAFQEEWEEMEVREKVIAKKKQEVKEEAERAAEKVGRVTAEAERFKEQKQQLLQQRVLAQQHQREHQKLAVSENLQAVQSENAALREQLREANLKLEQRDARESALLLELDERTEQAAARESSLRKQLSEARAEAEAKCAQVLRIDPRRSSTQVIDLTEDEQEAVTAAAPSAELLAAKASTTTFKATGSTPAEIETARSPLLLASSHNASTQQCFARRLVRS